MKFALSNNKRYLTPLVDLAGGAVIELAPAAYLLGMGGGDKLVTVTRWGSQSEGAGWVMAGRKTPLNYLLSGKWLGTSSNQYAAFTSGHSWEVLASELQFPSGWKWFMGFFGQAMYKP